MYYSREAHGIRSITENWTSFTSDEPDVNGFLRKDQHICIDKNLLLLIKLMNRKEISMLTPIINN